MTLTWNARSLGLYTLRQQQALLKASLTAWQSSGSSLLHINCGDGAFLSSLQALGFHVSACEHNIILRERAMQTAPSGIEIQAAADDTLPYEDDSFHWALLFTDNENALKNALDEAQRVASSGVAVMFWNSLSLSGAYWQRCTSSAPAMLSWWTVYKTLFAMTGHLPVCRSILAGPPAYWRGRHRVRTPWHWPIPIGAWCVLRCDFPPARPITGLPLHVRRVQLRPETVLERSTTSIEERSR